MLYSSRSRMAAFLLSALCCTSARAQLPEYNTLPGKLELDKLDLVRRWYVQVPVLKNREMLLSVKAREGLVFVQTNQGMIYCLDAETGSELWRASVGGAKEEVFPPALTQDFVYATVGRTLVQLSRQNGRTLWTKELPALTTAGPAASETHVYANCANNRIYAISLTEDQTRNYTKRPIDWQYNTGGEMPYPPLLLPKYERLMVANLDGTLYALTLDERRLRFRFLTHAPISAPLAYLHDGVYVAAADFNLYKIDYDGKEQWRLRTSYPISAAPLPFLRDLYVTPQQMGLFNVDPETGMVRWINSRAKQLLAVSQKNVYTFDDFHNLMILSRQDGRSKASWPSPLFTISAANQYSDRLYLATPKGIVVCLHEKANAEPFLHPQTPETEKKPTETKDDSPKTNFFGEEVKPDKPGSEPAEEKKTRRSFFD